MIKKFKNKGFTVLESIVAIAILSLSVSGAFSAVTQSLSQATIAKDEIRAFYLAQEAIEIIRNKRDANQLAIINTGSGNWTDGIISACPAGRTCTIDVTNLSIYDCGTGGWGSCTQYLKQDPDTFLYSYGSGNTTNFKREIQIETV
ncbi:MAG: type II secretion system protein, partial [Candidatus Zambryskibacteria bacterium]